MESPINILVAKITGTLVYRTHGNCCGLQRDYQNFPNEPFDMVLDNEEQSPNCVYVLPNGNLCIYTSIGDEQVSSSIYIVQDWKIDHVPQAVTEMSFENFDNLFDKIRIQYGKYKSGVPKELLHIFEQKDNEKL